MGNNNVAAHDPSVGVRRRHLPNFVGEGRHGVARSQQRLFMPRIQRVAQAVA